MPSSFSAINTMSSALRAFQRELDVTGHNVSNVNTAGYSRQVVDLSAAQPYSYTEAQLKSLGTGVNVASITRVRDMFLESRYQEVSSEQSRLQAQSDGLAQIESIVHDPSAKGIGDALSDFFDGWSALASNPNQDSYRLQVQQTAKTLTGRIRTAYSELDSVKTQQTSQISSTLTQINDLGKKIASLNGQIRQESINGNSPNDLLDKRDEAIRDLSAIADVKTSSMPDGTISVALGQASLVDPSGFRSIPTSPVDPTTGAIGTGDEKITILGGKIRGMMDVYNSATTAQSRLDRLANQLRTSVNGVHSSGTTGNGTTGINFFNDASPQTGAADFDLSTEVKADAKNIVTSATNTAGDGGLALAISQLRDKPMANLSGKTLSDDFSDLVGQVGRDAKTVNDALDTQNALVKQVDSQIQSASGVSLDEEMASMLRFQRSYQAAAKALSTMDSVMDDLLNLIR